MVVDIFLYIYFKQKFEGLLMEVPNFSSVELLYSKVAKLAFLVE